MVFWRAVKAPILPQRLDGQAVPLTTTRRDLVLPAGTPTCHRQRTTRLRTTKAPHKRSFREVELVGLEPTTFALPARRSPS